MSTETIYALASGRPPAAIGIVRVSGPSAHEAARRIGGTLPPPRRVALREFRHPLTGDRLDQGLLLRFDGTGSTTGEDLVEFHCHGGRGVVDALLEALGAIEGLRPAKAGEFTRRAFENGRIDLTEAEGLADLIEAETESQRRAALALAEGGLRRQIEQWQERLLELSARAEAAIDYVEDEDTDADPSHSCDCGALAKELRSWLSRPRIEPLKDGVRVIVAGPPNVGKSSLLNAIAGTERAIVTDSPGTTRDHIEVPLSLQGVPILLTDTAGVRDAADPVERIGVERTRLLVESAGVVLWLGEPGDAPVHPRLIRVHARSDLPDRRNVPDHSVAVSSHTGEGLGALLSAIEEMVRTLVPGDDALALNRRQAAHVAEAAQALEAAESASDPVICAENLRYARSAFDRLTGRAGVEAVLDALFGRFCLGK